MAIEIERKFLVNHELWNLLEKPNGKLIKQSYLSTNPNKTIRVRVNGEKGFITLKGKPTGIIRPEFEYEIPIQDALDMISLFGETVIEKIRYEINIEQHTWEVDVFKGDNLGLIVAEIELNNENESFKKPNWIEAEVTHDIKYLNANLQNTPYIFW